MTAVPPAAGPSFDPSPCPHCGATARLEPHPTLLVVCGACGAPRIPSTVAGGVPVAPAELAAATPDLQRARRAVAQAMRQRFAGWASLGTAALGLVLAALVGLLHAGAALALAVVALVPLAFSFLWRRRAARAEDAARAALEAAWSAALGAALGAARGSLTAADLAARVGVPVARLEPLLVNLAATDRVRVDVSDEGDLRYRVGLHGGAELLAADAEADADAADAEGNMRRGTP